MSNYRRNRIPGGTYFFTVNLHDRTSDLLITHIDALRAAVRVVKQQRPFHIDAWVFLPDLLLCIGTLPAHDDDYSSRWLAKKKHSQNSYPKSNIAQKPVSDAMNEASGKGVSGSIPLPMFMTVPRIWIIFITTR
ncbi:hypothetical protein [Nitrosomonas communis]|uniref:REP-associated tyrosine transposase n=1 Tax=Nitrosomonas communis TaxID=44574 RepID=UPI0026F2FDFE|nr:hypothetical protein [Nitrosomonas communis]